MLQLILQLVRLQLFVVLCSYSYDARYVHIQHLLLQYQLVIVFYFSCIVQGYFDPNVHIVTLNSTGTGVHYLSANNNNYYVTMDLNNNLQPSPESEIPNVS